MTRRAEVATALDGVELLLADLDGVVYTGSAAIPHAVPALTHARSRVAVGYVTNNAARTDVVVAEHLRSFGLAVEASEVVTSPQAAVALLPELVPSGAAILVVGGEGLSSEVEKAGYRVVRNAADRPAAVMQGFAPEVGWRELAEASFALARRNGGEIPWIATNTDWTIPQAQGVAPGNGTLVSAVHTAVGRFPVVAGKPERAIFDAALARFGASRALFLGDRLDTDIVGANRAGLASALVLTGIDGPKQVLAAEADSRPDFVFADLRELDTPYRVPTASRRGNATLYRCGDAVVVREGSSVRLRRQGTRFVEVLRAGAAAVWGAGSPIYALDVDPRLYSDR